VPVFRSYSAYSFYHVTVPVTSSSFVFFFSSSGAHRDLHSFPTRRSSDLELAHQWWGQAIGWKNYHEQWISEGFAQYFAALYAERERGPEQFAAVLRQMRRGAVEMSPQGPVYRGYRRGHIEAEGRVVRALVSNEGA